MKTQHIILKKNHMRQPITNQLEISNQAITVQQRIKILEVSIEFNLKMNKHFSNINHKLQQRVNFFQMHCAPEMWVPPKTITNSI